MQLVKRDQVYNTLDKAHAPAATVKPGETVRIQTQLQSGTWLNSIEDRWGPSKSKGPNLCTVVGVEGAEPGDTLVVEILDVVPEKLGYTGFAGWRTPLVGQILPEGKDWGTVTHTVEITKEGILWSPALTIPLKPMIGTIGTAPAGEAQTNKYAYRNGGNMDVQELCAGATLYLPVEVEGALLHVGDCHAIMGDGEIPHGGAIECAAEVTLRLSLRKGYAAKEWLRAENAVRLSIKEFELMQLLIKNNGRPLETDYILQQIWPGDPSASADTVWLYISYLRNKLVAVAAKLVIEGVPGGSFTLKEDTP